jgi:hypothetical protein
MTTQREPKQSAPDTRAMEAPREPRQPGRGKPGTMPENPGNVDHTHEPAGLEQGQSRLEKVNQHRRKDQP